MIIEQVRQSGLEIMIPLTEDGLPCRSPDGRKVWLFIDLERSEDAIQVLRREADRSTLNTAIGQTEVRDGRTFAQSCEESEQDSLRQTTERDSAIGVQWRPIHTSDRYPDHDMG